LVAALASTSLLATSVGQQPSGSESQAGAAIAGSVAGPNVAPKLANVDTGFRPGKDTFDYRNGDYESPGECLGISLFSVWYYGAHAAEGRPPLSKVFRDLHPLTPNADLVSREVGLKAQALALDRIDDYPGVPLRDPSRGRALYDRMKETGKPQILLLSGIISEAKSNDYLGHAVVVFGYRDGKFLIADPNYPGVTATWPFDPESGFGAYSNPRPRWKIDAVDFVSESIGPKTSAALSEILAGAIADGGEKDRYVEVEVTKLERSDRGLVAEGAIRGGIDWGDKPVHEVRVMVNGRAVPGATAKVQDGKFRVQVDLAKLGLAAKDVKLGLLANKDGPGGFAGYAEVPAPAPSKGLAGALGR
jgi:hypothetical protein